MKKFFLLVYFILDFTTTLPLTQVSESDKWEM